MASSIQSIGLVMLGLFCVSFCVDPIYHLNIEQVPLNRIEVTNDGDTNRHQSAVSIKTEEEKKVATGMIVNGWVQEESRFPYLISIQILEQKYKRYHICGAVLVTTNKALTAAHCMHYWEYGAEHYAAVGFTRLSGQGQALIKIVDVQVHRKYKYDTEGYPNDLAVITLEEHVQLTNRVQLANITKPGDPTYEYEFCYVAGWGMTEDYYTYPDELRWAVLATISNQDCKKFLKIFEVKNLIRKQHICAWRWPYSTCYGDSGGALVCGDQVVGIISWAPDCTGCFPVVFARIISFWNWIEKTIY